MTITRRGALLGAGAAAVVAGVPTAVDAQTREGLELFRQLNPERQKISLMAMRMFLETQRHHERMGLTEAEAPADLDRQMRGMRP